MTETKFIQWIRDNKGLDISQSGNFSTLGSLGNMYDTKEGVQLFYGLCVGGFPPHLDLSFIPYSLVGDTGEKKNFEYSDIMREFYTAEISNEERYKIITKQSRLYIDVNKYYETT